MIVQKYIENETKIKEIYKGNQCLNISSLRIRYFNDDWGSKDILSINIKEVCSSSVHHKSNIVFIVLAVFTAIVTFFMKDTINAGQYIGIGILITISFIITYFITRKQILIVASAGEKIVFNTRNMKIENLVNIIEIIDNLKENKNLNKHENSN